MYYYFYYCVQDGGLRISPPDKPPPDGVSSSGWKPPDKPPPDRPPPGGDYPVLSAHPKRSVRHQATGSSLALTAAKESKRVHQERSRCSSKRTGSASVSAFRFASSDASVPAAGYSSLSHSSRTSSKGPSRPSRKTSGEGHWVKPKSKPGASSRELHRRGVTHQGRRVPIRPHGPTALRAVVRCSQIPLRGQTK
jgi:hypothetical protein